MWSHERSITVRASPASVWEVLTDVAHWTDWHPNLKHAAIGGDFQPGTRIRLDQKGAPRTTVEIVACEAGRSYATEDRLPLARLRFEHEVEPAGDGTSRVTIRHSGTGLLAGAFLRAFGRKMEADLPDQLRLLAERAQEREA